MPTHLQPEFLICYKLFASNPTFSLLLVHFLLLNLYLQVHYNNNLNLLVYIEIYLNLLNSFVMSSHSDILLNLFLYFASCISQSYALERTASINNSAFQKIYVNFNIDRYVYEVIKISYHRKLYSWVL